MRNGLAESFCFQMAYTFKHTFVHLLSLSPTHRAGRNVQNKKTAPTDPHRGHWVLRTPGAVTVFRKSEGNSAGNVGNETNRKLMHNTGPFPAMSRCFTWWTFSISIPTTNGIGQWTDSVLKTEHKLAVAPVLVVWKCASSFELAGRP